MSIIMAASMASRARSSSRDYFKTWEHENCYTMQRGLPGASDASCALGNRSSKHTWLQAEDRTSLCKRAECDIHNYPASTNFMLVSESSQLPATGTHVDARGCHGGGVGSPSSITSCKSTESQ